MALPFAVLVAVYLPLVPLFGFAAAVAFAAMLAKARRRGRLRPLLLFSAAVAGCLALYAGRDVLGALSPLHRFATSVPGGHVPWGPADFFRFALGTRVLAPGWVNVEVPIASALNHALTPLYLVVVLAGAWHAARDPRTRPLAGAAGLLALGAAYFALGVRDPWSGRLGHTWNLFKLAQWGWPFVLLLAALAVKRLAPPRAAWRAPALALAVLLPASQAAVHWPWSERLGAAMREMLPGATLERAPRAAAAASSAFRPARCSWSGARSTLTVGSRRRSCCSATRVRSWATGPTARPSRTTRSAATRSMPRGSRAGTIQRVVPIVAGLAPFPPRGIEPLGGGFGRLLKQEHPVLLHVVNPAGVDGAASDAPSFSDGPRPHEARRLRARRGKGRTWSSALQPYPGRPGTKLVAFLAGGDNTHRSVRLASEGAPVATLPLGGETSLRVPLDLVAGLNTVVLVVDEGRGSLDAREPLTVTGLALVAFTPGR